MQVLCFKDTSSPDVLYSSILTPVVAMDFSVSFRHTLMKVIPSYTTVVVLLKVILNSLLQYLYLANHFKAKSLKIIIFTGLVVLMLNI